MNITIVMTQKNKLNSSVVNDPATSFNIIYSNLPLNERRLPIVVIENEPISWEMAYREINHKTQLGKQILEKLKELDII